MLFRPTMRLSWDDLDEQGCIDLGSPDRNSMTIIGPTKIRDARGHVTLQWSVTVRCEPARPVAPPPPLAVRDAAAGTELDPADPGRWSGRWPDRPSPQSPPTALEAL